MAGLDVHPADSAVPIRPDLVSLDGYHSPQVDVDVRLNTNESPLPPPDAWLAALQEELGRIDFNRYPDRQASELRAAVARSHNVRPDQVFCANGSNEILQCLLLAYGGPGRTVALFEPTYTLHRHIAMITGTGVVAGSRTDDFQLDREEVARVVAESQPIITFLCSPNNPTGRADPPDSVQRVVAETSGLVVVDEAYGQFAPSSALELVRAGGPGSERVVVVRTFSKTWSMAAARLGYMVASPDVVAACELVTLPYHLDAVKQAAGRLALQFEEAMHARVAVLREERGRIAAAFAEMSVETWPSDANFILFRPTDRSARQVWQSLLDRSVLVRDCSEWPGLTGCLRVTVGLPEENDRFLTALHAALEGPLEESRT
ncbi:MAG TPA: histidinol-phosphate transaminase [Acidimicrobiales bacterium]|nr:histidinol-phosphate transaminase [Acidimicrobiales bacterium]